MAGIALIGALVLAGGFVALVALRARQDQARQAGWASEARRLGLEHAQGDPLGLAARLGVDEVQETVHGRVDGRAVAALTVSKVPVFDEGLARVERSRRTWSVGVALDATGHDGAPVVVDRRPRGMALTHAPLPAAELEGLLRETAARAS